MFNILKTNKMKNLVLCLAFLLTVSCKTEKPKTNKGIATIISNIPEIEYTINPINDPSLIKEPYNLNLKIRKLQNNLYDLVIGMDLNDGAYYVSPNSKGDFKGIFTLILKNENNLKEISKLIETPLTVEEFDPHPFVNGNINWVRENTTYIQKLKRITTDEFQVFGLIQFTIEPRCTLEKIPFVINYKNGSMSIELNNC